MKTFRNYLLAEDKSQASISIIERSVYSFLNWCEDQRLEVEQVHYSDLLAYMKHLQRREVKQRTVQMAISHLKHFFTWQLRQGKRSDQPTEGIEVKGVQRTFLYHTLPLQKLETLYKLYQGNAAFLSGKYLPWEEQSHYATKTRQVVYGLVIWQGLGVGELKRMKVEDVKLREGLLHVEGSRRSNERSLQLQSTQMMDLMEYLLHVRPWYQKQNPEPTELLFMTSKGGEWGNNFMHGFLSDLSNKEPQITSMKQLRASVITHWLKTHNLRQVQYMAGHRYVSSTEAYRVNDLADLQEDIVKFHPF
ncbi:MAG: tyrosine-type recombinase/integrase [Bacteroidetes bacterium]|nr:tyrosine-type recombinase/integrase [Bacteroidota bacterium]